MLTAFRAFIIRAPTGITILRLHFLSVINRVVTIFAISHGLIKVNYIECHFYFSDMFCTNGAIEAISSTTDFTIFPTVSVVGIVTDR